MQYSKNSRSEEAERTPHRAANGVLRVVWKAGSLVLAAVFLAAVFAACSGDDGEPDPTSTPQVGPTATQEQPDTTSAPDDPTPSQEPGVSTNTPVPAELSVAISDPREGDSVGVGITVRGESQGIASGQVPDNPPPWIYVVIKPIPGDPNQSWWVQPYPLVSADGTWNAFVFVGEESDVRGTPFDLCAIISNDRLAVDRFGGEPPAALSRDCIRVTR